MTMNYTKSLFSFLKNKKNSEKVETPDGFCPNCWGRQEFAGKFYDAVKNHGLDVNSKNPEVGWITDYAEKHLKGIRLIDQDDKTVCQYCKISYRQR